VAITAAGEHFSSALRGITFVSMWTDDDDDDDDISELREEVQAFLTRDDEDRLVVAADESFSVLVCLSDTTGYLQK
jgi:hypothetical protein